MGTDPCPATAEALDALYRACRACAENIAEFDTITDPEILRDLTAALDRVGSPPPNPEPSAAETLDNAMVDALAAAMKFKLAHARAKGRGGWQDPAECSVRDLWDMLIEHARKPNLDMADVANLAGMIRWRLEHVVFDPAVLSEYLAAVTQPRPPENRWLPGEERRSGVYTDDNCEGGYLRVFADEQGDVHFSMWGKHPIIDVRMVAHVQRRPHVLKAARALADALKQEGDG